MPDGDGRDYVLLRTCVLFWDALHWIAYRDFAHPGNRIGPRMLGVLPRFDEEGDDEEAGRYGLAFELLIDHASRGNIRLYARDGRSDLLEPGQKLEFPCQLSPDFVKRADYTCEDGEGPSLYDEDQGYHDLAVDHSDLICEFWNESRHGSIAAEQESAPQLHVPPPVVPRLRRRGRRPQYAWPEFAAELVRRVLSGKVNNQAALERHMQEWCAVTWNAEPSTSEIRNWVAPVFKAANAARSAGNSKERPEIPAPAAE